MNAGSRVFSTVLVALSVSATAYAAPAATPDTQQGATQTEKRDEGWQKEFDEACSKTTDAMSLSSDELHVLVQRCDALVPRIEKLDETRRKVYLRRLGQCRGLYAYVLESKNVDAKNGTKSGEKK
jgi:hypothetical protein